MTIDVDAVYESGKLWEDIHDQLVADSRAHEKSVSFEVVKRRLERRKRQTRA